MVGSDRNVAMAAKQAALKAFGARLHEARSNTSLTQEDVADKLTVSTQTVRNWEAGRTEPSRSDKERLASLYNKPVEWFLGENEEEQQAPEPDTERPSIGADRALVMNEASLALRSTGKELSDEAIRSIADFIRFVHEKERRESQPGS